MGTVATNYLHHRRRRRHLTDVKVMEATGRALFDAAILQPLLNALALSRLKMHSHSLHS